MRTMVQIPVPRCQNIHVKRGHPCTFKGYDGQKYYITHGGTDGTLEVPPQDESVVVICCHPSTVMQNYPNLRFIGNWLCQTFIEYDRENEILKVGV
jgi:hypothetical protein